VFDWLEEWNFFRLLLLKGSWDSIVGVVTGVQPGQSGVEISGMSMLALQTTQLHIQWVLESRSSRLTGWYVRLTNLPPSSANFKVGGALFLLHLCAFMVFTGTSLPLPFAVNEDIIILCFATQWCLLTARCVMLIEMWDFVRGVLFLRFRRWAPPWWSPFLPDYETLQE